jgi:hypothetical protein
MQDLPDNMKIGFTGTRHGMSQHQKEQFVLKMMELGCTEFHHGDCEGADAEAHDIVREFFPDVRIEVYPPKSDYMRAFRRGDFCHPTEDYIARDRNIVNRTEYLIGAPLHDVEELRSGTWTTIRHARRTQRPLTILER